MEYSNTANCIEGLSQFDLLRYNKLGIIFKRSSEFLPSSDLVTLLSLSHFFNTHLLTPEFLATLAFRYLSFLTTKPVTYENIFQIFEDFSGIQSHSILEIIICLRKTTNLIKNPCGELKFNDWKVKHSGESWITETQQVYKSMKAVFVNIYNRGSLTQKIDLEGLIKEGKSYVLVAGSPITRKWDFGGWPRIHIKVCSKKGKVREGSSVLDAREFSENHPWVILGGKVLVRADDSFVKIKFKGLDDKQWAGNYGARFGYCYALLLETNRNFNECY